MAKLSLSAKLVIASLVVTQYGGRPALGFENGRGGISLKTFSAKSACDKVRELAAKGVKVALQPTGSPNQFALVL